MAVRRAQGSPVSVRIKHHDTVLDEINIMPHDYVLHRRVYDLEASTEGMIHFEIQAEDPAFRELLIEADVLGNVPVAMRSWLDESPGR